MGLPGCGQALGQSPRHGVSRMKHAAPTDACGIGATPPRSSSMFIAKTLSGEPWRPLGARRSSGHVSGLQEQRRFVWKSESPYTGAKLPARSVTNWPRPPTAGLAKTLLGKPWRPTRARRSSGHVPGLPDGMERSGEKRQGIVHNRMAAEDRRYTGALTKLARHYASGTPAAAAPLGQLSN